MSKEEQGASNRQARADKRTATTTTDRPVRPARAARTRTTMALASRAGVDKQVATDTSRETTVAVETRTMTLFGLGVPRVHPTIRKAELVSQEARVNRGTDKRATGAWGRYHLSGGGDPMVLPFGRNPVLVACL